jgi:hypothetical protein
LFDETSVHLGATPFYSPTFRENWEVRSLIKQKIETTDKFELTLHREFRKAHSLRELEQTRETLNEGFYNPGDYALIVCFKGDPALMKWSGAATTQTLDLKEVDSSPVKLMMTSRSSISVTAPDLFTTDNAPTTRPTGGNYIAGEGRVLDVSLDTHAYLDTNWTTSVITNVKEEEGGSR